MNNSVQIEYNMLAHITKKSFCWGIVRHMAQILHVKIYRFLLGITEWGNRTYMHCEV